MKIKNRMHQKPEVLSKKKEGVPWRTIRSNIALVVFTAPFFYLAFYMELTNGPELSRIGAHLLFLNWPVAIVLLICAFADKRFMKFYYMLPISIILCAVMMGISNGRPLELFDISANSPMVGKKITLKLPHIYIDGLPEKRRFDPYGRLKERLVLMDFMGDSYNGVNDSDFDKSRLRAIYVPANTEFEVVGAFTYQSSPGSDNSHLSLRDSEGRMSEILQISFETLLKYDNEKLRDDQRLEDSVINHYIETKGRTSIIYCAPEKLSTSLAVFKKQLQISTNIDIASEIYPKKKYELLRYCHSMKFENLETLVTFITFFNAWSKSSEIDGFKD